MNTLGNVNEQVARLEALLKRVQVNAAALRGERGEDETIAAPVSLAPSSDSPSSGFPITAPTGTVPPRAAQGTLPDFLEQPSVAADGAFELDQVGFDADAKGVDVDEPVTQVPAPPVEFEPATVAFEPVAAKSATPEDVPLDSLESDLPTLPPSRDDDFQDPNTEHTKPLWLGLNNGTGTFRSDGIDGARIGDAHRTLAETPAAKVYDTSGGDTSLGFSTYEEAPIDAPVALEPVAGDAIGTLDAVFAQQPEFAEQTGFSEQTGFAEPAVSLEQPGFAGPVGTDIAAFDNGLGEEEHLDTSPPISGHRASSRSPELSSVADSLTTDDLEQELEMSPTYVDDSGGRISDAPPSVIGATITLPEETSAVALELLEPPPSNFRSSQPAADDELEAELPRTSFRAEYDASLSAPPSAVEDLRARDRADQERKALEQRTSRSPERVSVGQLSDDDLPPVLSSRPASPSGVGSMVYTPETGAVPAVFEGARPALRGLAFLELLDASLAINAR